MPYRAPVAEYRFILDNVVGFDALSRTERFAEATRDTAAAILTEAARLADDVLAPLQRAGDLHPARLENGAVRASPGFAEGYRAIAEGGWIGMAADAGRGGMGLPMTLCVAVNEMMAGACLSLQLCPLLTQGQIEALQSHASEDIRERVLPRLVTGEWTGTMNLTEPQAGSDVGALRTRAVPYGDGTFSLSGQKIYITWGDHDMASNVVHLVLARLPDAPAGSRGISLFLVPRNLPDAAGNPGPPNGVRAIGLEHKLGLHGSPTAVMEFDRATGWLVGQPNRGLAAMFTMMNNARLNVGVQGVGVAEAAFQSALTHARGRVQGRTPPEATGDAILGHADVRRMLACMKAEILAARALSLDCAVAMDRATAGEGAEWAARAAFLIPIVKAQGTDIGCQVADMGLQVHGGMGFIEETGAAQFLRDVRVTPIYEGTNGIQAMDLVGRKLSDGGVAAFRLLDEVDATATAAAADFGDLAGSVAGAAGQMRSATEWMLVQSATDRNAGAAPYLRAFARVLGGHYHLRAALAGEGKQGPRAALARVFINRLLPESGGLLQQARAGADTLYALSDEDLAT